MDKIFFSVFNLPLVELLSKAGADEIQIRELKSVKDEEGEWEQRKSN